MLPRVSTGIKGLDQVLGGGYPKERTILFAGPAGSGKSTSGLAFLVDGILREDEPGIYVSFDESLENVRMDAYSSYGWDLRQMEREGRLAMVDGFSKRAGVESSEKYVIALDIDEMLTYVINLIDNIGAERVVIDSITAVALGLDDEVTRRKEILKLSAVLSSLTCTTLLISEMRQGEDISRFGVEEFVSQGVIVVKYMHEKTGRRSLQIRKMRGIKHSMKEMPFLLSDEGLAVYPDEELYDI